MAQSGAKFGKLCLVGRRKSLHSRSKPRTRSKLVGRTSSLLPAKRLRSYARASGSFKPATLAERLRGVGNSSGDENGSDPIKHRATILVTLAALCSSLALADDFKTINGKEYKDATVSRVEPDGIVLKTKSGISKVYFVELSKEVQERFHYNPANAATQSAQHHANTVEPATTSGIEDLPPITVELKNEILDALKMTDKLDALYKRGCTSAEFIAAATPIESVFINLHKQLPKGDPRRDLLANTFEAYQQTAVAMKGYEQGRGERPDALVAAAGIRKGLLTKILEGNMTPAEKEVYYAWRKATETNP